MLPVYDKPMVYYPLSTVMSAGVTDVLVITSKEYLHSYQTLLHDGSQFGISIRYAVQSNPKGIADAYRVGARFVEGQPSILVLGDNIFYGEEFDCTISALRNTRGATIFAYRVEEPERFGVVQFDASFKVISLEEKPSRPKSNWAATGLYLFDHQVTEIAARLQPSARGELEITDVNRVYLSRGELNAKALSDRNVWWDTGTPRSLHEAGDFVASLEAEKGIKIGCPEEIALRHNLISVSDLERWMARLKPSDYLNYLKRLADQASSPLSSPTPSGQNNLPRPSP